jgi:cytochrome c oxidase subunit 4
MHLEWEANWKWVLTVPASLMSMLLVFALVPDIGRRMRYASHERMVYAAETPAGEKHGENATTLTPHEAHDTTPAPRKADH